VGILVSKCHLCLSSVCRHILVQSRTFFLSLGPMVTVISQSVFNLFLNILFKTNNKPAYNSYDNHVIYTYFSGPLVGYIP
jgi:hypothetical protein